MTTRDGDDRVAEAIEALAASNERIASAITAAAA